jgi:hypothetical protein
LTTAQYRLHEQNWEKKGETFVATTARVLEDARDASEKLYGVSD